MEMMSQFLVTYLSIMALKMSQFWGTSLPAVYNHTFLSCTGKCHLHVGGQPCRSSPGNAAIRWLPSTDGVWRLWCVHTTADQRWHKHEAQSRLIETQIPTHRPNSLCYLLKKENFFNLKPVTTSCHGSYKMLPESLTKLTYLYSHGCYQP